MIYEIGKMRREEVLEFKQLITRYKNFDKLDILIDLTLQKLGVSRGDFECREVKQEKKNEELVVQTEADEYNKFCDGDKCELPIFQNSRC